MKSVQLELTFEGGLLDQFPEFRDVVRTAVYSCGRPFKNVASDLDLSPSLLSRMLSENDAEPRHLPLFKLPEIVQVTGDKRPLYWLIEKFLEEPDKKHARVMDELATMLPHLQRLLTSEGAKRA